MLDNKKCVEFYMDSKQYSNEQIIECINKTKEEFSNKNVNVQIDLNEYGVYIIKMNFENKENYFSKIKNKININSSNNQVYTVTKSKYGQYKSTGIYRPI